MHRPFTNWNIRAEIYTTKIMKNIQSKVANDESTSNAPLDHSMIELHKIFKRMNSSSYTKLRSIVTGVIDSID